MTLISGSITEYACAYGNSGNFPRQRRGILLNWGYPNTMHISQPTVAEATGLCLVWVRLTVPYQKKD